MAWTKFECDWRSLVTAKPLRSGRPPFSFETPEAPWSYGAISSTLPGGMRRTVKLRIAATQGLVSAALAPPNGSVFRTQELSLRPEDGEQDLYFEYGPEDGAVCVLLRNFGISRSQGRLLSLEIGDQADLERDQDLRVAGPAPAVDASQLALNPSNIALADEPMQPISLGNSCEAKIQICRTLQTRFRDDVSIAAFRMMMSPPSRSRSIFEWNLFDWQGTPFNTLLYYFDRNFENLYAREDLITDGFSVLNRRTGAEHRHDYEVLKPSNEPVTEALIDQGYPAARAQFEDMTQAFVQRLSEPGEFLYILTCEDFPTEFRTRLLMRRLASRSPDHRFHLLIVGLEEEDQDLSALSAQVTKAYRPKPRENAHPFDWDADYSAWDRAFASFDIRFPPTEPLKQHAVS